MSEILLGISRPAMLAFLLAGMLGVGLSRTSGGRLGSGNMIKSAHAIAEA